MIFVDLRNLDLPEGWLENAKSLTIELKAKVTLDEKKAFIEDKRNETWAHSNLVAALKKKKLAGNKCWYSEVPLEGADHNVDHFRPKGRVRDINEDDKLPCGICHGGYWWLAFDYRNFRLSCQHANLRRVDVIGGTDGGKVDFFPVDGVRCTTVTDYNMIHEKIFALDPCSPTDVALLHFNSDGKPIVRKGKNGVPDPWEERRVKMSVWLYHLDKSDLVTRRSEHMAIVKQEFEDANCDYQNWQAGAISSKASFDRSISRIRNYLKDDAPLAGSARSMKRLLAADFEWIDEFLGR